MATEVDENTAVADPWSTVEDVSGGESMHQLVTLDVPEIKLFGKWSLNDVDVSDISLVVCICIPKHFWFTLITTQHNFRIMLR